MTADETGHTARRIGLLLGIGGFAAMAVFWTLIFTGFFSWRNPDQLHDEAWVEAARATCKPTADLIDALPRAQTAESPAERAAAVEKGTVAIESMVDDLAANPPDNESDREVVSGWLKDWRIYIGDRKDFTKRLRADPTAKPLFTEVHGGWSTDAINAFADANKLEECSAPGDL